MIYNYYQGVDRQRISKLLMIAVGIVLATAATFSLSGFASADTHCKPTDAGSANYVNEVPNEPFDVTCEIGIYFDENGKIDGAEIRVTTEDAESEQYGVYVDGANVDVVNSSITVDADFPHQIVGMAYQDEATGKVKSNELDGPFRAAVLVRGANTDVDLLRNTIVGTSAKTNGWAENGIQVDQGAVVNIVNNHVEGFWWDGESNWASTAIMLYGSNSSSVVNNDVIDSEFSIIVFGDNNQVKGNDTSSAVESTSSLEFRAWGVLLAGNGNKVAGNNITAQNGLVGVYFYEDSEKNRLTGNRVSGFDYNVVDDGDNVVRGLVTPVQ